MSPGFKARHNGPMDALGKNGLTKAVQKNFLLRNEVHTTYQNPLEPIIESGNTVAVFTLKPKR
jgi:hypothetical protein